MPDIRSLNWSDWIGALVSAGIAGGAQAVISTFQVSSVDPEHFAAWGSQWWILMAKCFVASAVIAMLAVLKQSPLPGVLKTKETLELTAPGINLMQKTETETKA